MAVTGAYDVTMSDLTLRNGKLPSFSGGAIYHSAGSLTLTNITFTGNSALNGGALASGTGPLILINSRIPQRASKRFRRAVARITASYRKVALGQQVTSLRSALEPVWMSWFSACE